VEHDRVRIHPSALVETRDVGTGTAIWAFCHVLEGAVVGRDCNIGDGCYIESGARIGDGVTVKNGCMIWDGVTIEDWAFIGPGVVFTNDLRPRSPRGPHARGRYADDAWLARTLVGAGATIGARAVVLPGLEVGPYAMVAAGSVVTRTVPAHALVAGAPAERRGWVCACGERLHLEDGAARCGACRRAFAARGEGIVEASDAVGR
jgi:UDP-2-acetamido-3-amino-2,3-dideoxy-glucuronate N-acetyltransferase